MKHSKHDPKGSVRLREDFKLQETSDHLFVLWRAEFRSEATCFMFLNSSVIVVAH